MQVGTSAPFYCLGNTAHPSWPNEVIFFLHFSWQIPPGLLWCPFTQRKTLFRPLLDFRCVIVHLFFVHRYETVHKFLWMAIEQRQTGFALVVHCEQTWPSDVICLWFHELTHFQFLVDRHHISSFTESTDLDWASRTFDVHSNIKLTALSKFLL